MEEILQVRKDNLFHDLVCENDMLFLEWIVMQILDLKYDIVKGKVTIENIRLPRVKIKDRNKYVDIRLRYEEYIIILEINNHFRKNYMRNVIYCLNSLISNYQKGEGNYYKDINRVVLVNLNWFNNIDYSIDLIERIELPYPDYNEIGFLLKIVNVNLDKYATTSYNEIRENEYFYKLLTINNKKELIEFTKGNKLLSFYVKNLIEYSKENKYKDGDNMSEAMEENLWKQELYMYGKHDGINQGISKGTLQKEKDVVLEMHKDNVSVTTIAKYVKLSVKKVKEIISSNK